MWKYSLRVSRVCGTKLPFEITKRSLEPKLGAIIVSDCLSEILFLPHPDDLRK